MAGSNSTTRGVPRRVLQAEAPQVQAIGASQIPTIQYSTGAASALAQWSRDMFSLSNQFQDQLDEQAKAEGSAEGAVAGATGDFELKNYGTIRGRSYNQSALETFASTIDTQSMYKVAELKQKFWNDPEGLQRELDAYGKGVGSELAKKSPEQAAVFNSRFATRGLGAVEQAKDAAFATTRSEADAALIQNEAALRVQLKEQGADLFSDNPERSRAAAAGIEQTRLDFMRIYSAKDKITGKPLYSPEEQAKATQAFKDATISQGLLSWFDEQPDKAGAYLKIANGDFKMNIEGNNGNVKFVNALGPVRKLPVGQDWFDKTAAAVNATGPGISVKMISAGQEQKSDNPVIARQQKEEGRRTGSTRHDVDDHGQAHTADIVLQRNGQDVTPNEDPELYRSFIRNSAAAGFTGIGTYPWGIHVGDGKEAFWGPDTTGATADASFKQAFEQGRAGAALETKPSKKSVAIGDTLSPAAFNSLDAEMRSRISFTNAQVDRARTQNDKAVSAQQETSSFVFSSRIYGAGSKDANGNVITPPTQPEINEAVRTGALKPNDGQAILKLMTTDHPQQSDEPAYRDAIARIYAGEDVTQVLRDKGDRLSKSDLAQLYGLNQSVVKNNNGDFSQDQKFYYDLLGNRVSGGNGMFDKFDQGKADRAAAAKSEYRRRVLDPNNTEPPEVIANDIVDRTTRQAAGMAQGELSKMIIPRFAEQVQGEYRIDIPKSKKALQAAYSAKKINDAEVIREIDNLKRWEALQAIELQNAKTKGK